MDTDGHACTPAATLAAGGERKKDGHPLDDVDKYILYPALTKTLEIMAAECVQGALEPELEVTPEPPLAPNTKIRSLVWRTLAHVLEWANLTLKDDVQQALTHYLPVHPSNARELASFVPREEDDASLAQALVHKERLIRIATTAQRKHPFRVNALLAIDGLATVTDSPRYDVRRYVDRMRIGRTDDAPNAEGMEVCAVWTRADADERAHVHGIRRLYRLLGQWEGGDTAEAADRAKHAIHRAMRLVYKPSECGEKGEDEALAVRLSEAYMSYMRENEREGVLERLAGKLFVTRSGRTNGAGKKRARPDSSESEGECDATAMQEEPTG